MKVFIYLLITSFLFLVSSNSIFAANCTASTNAEFRTCQAQVVNGSADTILVTNNITCSATTPCNFVFTISNRPITIAGTSANSGFTRDANASEAVLSFIAHKNITLTKLNFKDINNNLTCVPNTGTCANVILLHNVETALIDNINMTDIAQVGIVVLSQMSTPPQYTVQNSTFKNIGLHALLTYYRHETPIGGVAKILNNTFENIKSNAIAINVNSNSSNPSIVSGNIFRHNHNTPMYFSCNNNDGLGPVSGCTGGQIYIWSPVSWDQTSATQNVIIEKNLITDGFTTSIDVWGIEVLRVNVKNLTIHNNVFVNNDTAMIIDADGTPGSFISSGIVDQNNYFYNNPKITDNYGHPYPISESGHTILGSLDAATSMFSQIRPTAPASPVVSSQKIGDFNQDGTVDLADFAVWKKEYLGQLTTKSADFNHDNIVNLLDFGIWKKAYLNK